MGISSLSRLLVSWAPGRPLRSWIVRFFASGIVQVETKNKTIQHLEGGLIRKLHVRDSDPVKKGQLLVELDPTESKANLDALFNQLYAEEALIARLTAEQDRAEEITFPPEVLAQQDNPVVSAAIRGQRQQFQERLAYQKSQVSILNARIDQITKQNGGLEIQKESVEEQLVIYEEELASLEVGAEKGVYPKNQLLQKRRNFASLKGDKGEFVADIAANKGRIIEVEEQIKQVEHQFLQQVSENLAAAKRNRDRFKQQVIVAQDIYNRNQIYAPYEGVVQNVKFHTVGGVIQRGETIMDLIPVNDNLVISARLQPVDIDKVKTGLQAEVRFPSFASRRLPIILGKVESITADTLLDRASNTSYFSVQVAVPEKNIPEEIVALIKPGYAGGCHYCNRRKNCLELSSLPTRKCFAQSHERTMIWQ